MNADDLVPGGFPCDQQAAISLPPREDVVHTDSLASSPCVQQHPPRVARPVTDPARRIVHGTDPGGSRRARWARTSPWHRTGGCHRLREDIPHAVLRGRWVLPLAPPPGAKLSLIHISEPTRQAETSYAVFCLKKKK